MLKKPSEPLSHAKATPQLFLTKLHIILTFNKHILLNNVNPPGIFVTSFYTYAATDIIY